jgi:hypothetical protein
LKLTGVLSSTDPPVSAVSVAVITETEAPSAGMSAGSAKSSIAHWPGWPGSVNSMSTGRAVRLRVWLKADTLAVPTTVPRTFVLAPSALVLTTMLVSSWEK